MVGVLGLAGCGGDALTEVQIRAIVRGEISKVEDEIQKAKVQDAMGAGFEVAEVNRIIREHLRLIVSANYKLKNGEDSETAAACLGLMNTINEVAYFPMQQRWRIGYAESASMKFNQIEISYWEKTGEVTSQFCLSDPLRLPSVDGAIVFSAH